MARFRKRPVEVDAVQFTGTEPHPDGVCLGIDAQCVWADTAFRGRPHVHTLEGILLVSPGDWVIRGIRGEYHPCRADIFEETYEPVPNVSVWRGGIIEQPSAGTHCDVTPLPIGYWAPPDARVCEVRCPSCGARRVFNRHVGGPGQVTPYQVGAWEDWTPTPVHASA